MPGLDELSEESRRNTRARFEQWVKNPLCDANAMSAVLDVKMSDVARSLGYEPEYGQSPFAIARGLQFEGWLFKDQAKVMREALERVGMLSSADSGFLDLRLRMNGGSTMKSVAQALEASTQLLHDVARPDFSAPSIVAGLLLRIPKGVMLPEATLIIDVVVVTKSDGFWTMEVGEIKVFPDRGGFTDPTEIATARAQAGVYQHALELTINSLQLPTPPVVKRSGFLVFTWPGTNSPVIRANEDLTHQSRRAQDGFEQLDAIAVRLTKDAMPGSEPDAERTSWIAHSRTEYREKCWGFCDLAPRCQDTAIAEDRAVVLGTEAARALGSVTLSRALQLLNGSSPNGDFERDLQQRLQSADWKAPS